MIFADTVLPAIDQFINYGSFGLVCFLVFMFVYKIWPSMRKEQREEREETQARHVAEREDIRETFKNALDKLVASFNKTSADDREERLAVARDAATEREKDREVRHMLNNTLTGLVAQLEKGHA